MKITRVSYRSLRTGRGYNNSSVEATAEVGDDENPEAVLSELRFWVDRSVDETLKREDAYEALESIRGTVEYQMQESARLEKRIMAQRAVIAEHSDLAEIARREGKGGGALLLETAS